MTTSNVKNIIQKYQDEVDAIPEWRPLVTLYCEAAVKVLPELEAKCSPEMDYNTLIRFVMMSCRGHISPVDANSLIEEWLEAKKE